MAMKYTVKQLAESSGISTRTLRFYDKIGLLSPAFYADNGYRYYAEKEMLVLQQILFFRELGFKLEDIKAIITSADFDQAESLKKHKSSLLQKIANFKNLVKTIDKTLNHLSGKKEIKEYELYLGFKHPKQLEMIQYLEEHMGSSATKIIEQSKEKMKELSVADIKAMQKEAKQWAQSLKKAIISKHLPSSRETQKLIEVYYQKRIKRFCTPTTDEFVELIKTECKHPEYKKLFTEIHPQFARYLLTAVKYYTKTQLKKQR